MTATFTTRVGVALAVHGAGSGRVMVFQHGLCGDANQPAQVFPPEAGFARLTVDCRGHGGSDCGPPQGLSIASFAQDLAEVITARGLGPCVIGGISMGAAIALRLAVTRPDLVTALVLARPAWLTGAAPANMAPNALVGALLRDHPVQTARDLFEASPTAAALAKAAPDNLASLRGFFARAPQDVTSALLLRISADGPGVTEAQIAALTLPTLVIGTAQDAVHPLDHARRLARLIPQARLAEITPKAQDLAAHQQEFRATLAGFLTAL